MHMLDAIKRWYNKARIMLLAIFTDRVKRFEITAPDGKKHSVTAVQEAEDVCAHAVLREIAPTMWQCDDKCKDMYFMIGYKIMLSHSELIAYLEKTANSLGCALADKE